MQGEAMSVMSLSCLIHVCHPRVACLARVPSPSQISATEEHVNFLKSIFDFGAIKSLLGRDDFNFVYDSMHGVQGPYAKVSPDAREARVSNSRSGSPPRVLGGG